MDGDMGGFAATHLPIVKEYARRMGIPGIIDRALSCGMNVSPGQVVVGLIMDVMCRRSLVYWVEEFFRTRDVGLLLGDGVTVASLSDDTWHDAGRFTDRRVKGKEVGARYRYVEDTVELHGQRYRAIVVHSDAHDRRRQKRIDRMIRNDRDQVAVALENFGATEFFCLPDAQAAAATVPQGVYHRVTATIVDRPVFGRGRPPKNGPRPVRGVRYRIEVTMSQDTEGVARLREEAGCFVLMTSVPVEEKTGREILQIYKEQDGVERNFGFLKDPQIVNACS